MPKLPYFQFYPGDWLKDPKLSLCSPAARGVWMDLLCAMHELQRSGKLSGTPEQLARLTRCSTVELGHALTEIQTTGTADVTERNGIVTVVNRRMNREYKYREATRLRVNRHRGHEPCNAECNGVVTPYIHIQKSEVHTHSPRGPDSEVSIPSLDEVFNAADLIGLARWKAEAWFNEMEGCGWEMKGRPIRKWRSILNNVLAYWKADGSPSSPLSRNGQKYQKPRLHDRERKTEINVPEL